MSDRYILDGRTPVRCDDLYEWAQGLESSKYHKGRHVADTHIGVYRVSTIFLGIDHNFGSAGPPILFETMVFKNDSFDDHYCDRYSTWDEAERGHLAAVDWAEARLREARLP